MKNNRRRPKQQFTSADLKDVVKYSQENYSGYFDKTVLTPLKNIKNNFNIAVIFIFGVGITLMVLNLLVYKNSLTYVDNVFTFIDYAKFGLFGIIGIAISFFVIIVGSISYAGNPKALDDTYKKGQLRKPLAKNMLYILLAIVVLIGIFITLTIVGNNHRLKTQNYIEVDGVIVELIEKIQYDDDGQKEYLYTHIYEYQVNGVTYRYQENQKRSGTAVGKIGDIVALKYDPANPNTVTLKSYGDIFKIANYIIIIIIVAIIIQQLGQYNVITSGIFNSYILMAFPVIAVLLVNFDGMITSPYQLLFKHPWLAIFLIFANLSIITTLSAIINKVFNNQNINKTIKKKA